MKDLLHPLIEYFEKNDQFKRRMENFVRIQKTKDWEFFIYMMRAIQGIIANDMLERRFTELSKEDKDVISRTYYHINKMIEFFINPLAEIRKRAKWNLPTRPQIQEAVKKAAYK